MRDVGKFECVLLPFEMGKSGMSLFKKLRESGSRREKRQRSQTFSGRLKFVIHARGTEFVQHPEIVQQHLLVTIAQNFFTLGNFFEVTRVSVELGLLALALTPVIITGGIDLSVGSMMGLAAIAFGGAYRDWHLPIAAAAAAALLVGCAGGLLNALLIARLNLPPLIVTLGSMSMFRGIAEGLTHGATNYSGFPRSFLALGQGYLWGVIPPQLPIFMLVLAGYAVLLHRSVLGRAWYAIGFGAAGARYAG